MKQLTQNQKKVLELACTHGHVNEGCLYQKDFGGRLRTINSLRKLKLLDVLNRPTMLGKTRYEILNQTNVL